MDAATLARCTGATAANAALFAQPLTDAMARFQIDTPRRQAAFLASVAIESTNLSQLEESLYYRDPSRLVAIYPRAFKTIEQAAPYARNPQALGNLLYQGYWGRGALGLTWLKNYQAAAAATGCDYVNQPELVKEPVHAALTAAWFWDAANCNAPADLGDMRGVTLRVNGPALLKLADRTAQYLTNLSFLTSQAQSASWGNEDRR